MSQQLSLNHSAAAILPTAKVEEKAPTPFDCGSHAIEVLPLRDLDMGLVSQWSSLRTQESVYRSPFFSFEFVKAVAAVGPQIEVAVVRQDQQLLAALPFQRISGQFARPVGLGVNDAHGYLKRPGVSVDPLAILRGCRLSGYEFHAAPPNALETERFAVGRTRSFLADLTVDPRGYENYLKENSDTIDRQGQKTRKLIRTLGSLRLEFDCRDPAMLDLLIKLKCDQYQRTHTYNILAVDWIQRLMHRLHGEGDSPVRGILSVLYAGHHPVALHYGMTEGTLLHYWFPVYDAKYSYGSPGTILFLEIAKQATERGYQAIDMGYGEQPYKHKLTNVITEMSYGLVDSSPMRRALYRAQLGWQKRVKKLWLKDLVKPLVRKLLPNLGAKRFGGA